MKLKDLYFQTNHHFQLFVTVEFEMCTQIYQRTLNILHKDLSSTTNNTIQKTFSTFKRSRELRTSIITLHNELKCEKSLPLRLKSTVFDIFMSGGFLKETRPEFIVFC